MSAGTHGWDDFLELCLATKDKKILSQLFDLFFTQEERDDFAKRCLIVKEMLLQQKTQRDIAKDLQVSIAKITRGSNELKRTDAKLIQYLCGLWQIPPFEKGRPGGIF